jgi:DNA polymerase-3 subunit epsilon
MRQIVLDTETTGLEVRQGHRLIEIACVEMIERRPSGRHYQTYLNPDRAIDEGAKQVTGIEDEFLLDKPHFIDVVEEFLAFIDGAELIIHNATFDVGFLDSELARAGEHYGRIADRCSVLDTLMMARERYPGQRNSLDALCKRLGVDNSARDLHGGLIDAQLLAEVYISMTSGQVGLDLGFEGAQEQGSKVVLSPMVLSRRPRVLRANDEENVAHEKRLDGLDKSSGGTSVWRREDAPTIN